MEDISQYISNNFNANITYLEKYHQVLFQKLSAYESAVDAKKYQERYELVYENEGFDVVEIATKNYLYNKKSQTHTELSTQSVNKRVDNNVFESFTRQSFSSEALKKYEEAEALTSHLQYVAPIIDTISKNKPSHQELHSFDKFIFFGTGLALHIESIDKKIKAKQYLIVEDDLELFRLSLFTINYAKLAETSQLFFAVFSDETEFSEVVNTFLKQKYYLNHYIKYFQLLSHSEEKANSFHLELLKQPELRFLFHDSMRTMLKPLEYFSQHHQIVQKSLIQEKSFFENKPLLLLASGPSLQSNIQWLQENQQRFIIMAVSSSLQFLELHQIVPHIVIHLDPFERSIKSFERVHSLEFFKDSIFLLSASTPSNIVQLLQKQDIYFYETGTSYQNSSLSLSAPCVGSLSLLLLLLLQVQEGYILGLDLAVDQKTGKNHIDIHQDKKTLELKNSFKEESELTYKNSLIEIDGNFQKRVFTTPHFYASVDIINRYFSQLKKPFQNIYNLSSGAKLTNITPLHIEDVKLSNEFEYNTLQKSLREFFKIHTRNKLTDEDIKSLKRKLKNAKKMKRKLSEYQPKKVPLALQYVESIYNIFISEENLKANELSRAIDNYLYYILHYIYDYLNSDSLPQEKFREIDQLLKKELFSLIDYYIFHLQTTIKD